MLRLMAQRTLAGSLLRIVKGDLTLSNADAIVNAANTALRHGGGVAGAIVRRGGSSIQAQSDRIGHCPEGGAVVTGAGDLAARYVIHAVGPRGGDPAGDRKLAAAVTSALQRAHELGLASIALPAISTGIFGFPVERCVALLLGAVAAHLTTNPQGPLRRVDVVLLDEATARLFAAGLETIASLAAEA